MGLEWYGHCQFHEAQKPAKHKKRRLSKYTLPANIPWCSGGATGSTHNYCLAKKLVQQFSAKKLDEIWPLSNIKKNYYKILNDLSSNTFHGPKLWFNLP